MKLFKLVVFRNMLLITMLLSVGNQLYTSSYFDAFANKYIKVNLTENIYVIDVESIDFDQTFLFSDEILIKEIISENILKEKTLFSSKIYLNSWKPPKI
ncbi:MAG TPA: hypothetical protein VFY09_06095 [Flavobacteriaceae bacterium]|nr:hypothetical protein [Flavobacteriaceae bacterium]HEX5743453.1 hypothetical protein [Flavobacteriaceae bacterium]